MLVPGELESDSRPGEPCGPMQLPVPIPSGCWVPQETISQPWGATGKPASPRRQHRDHCLLTLHAAQPTRTACGAQQTKCSKKRFGAIGGSCEHQGRVGSQRPPVPGTHSLFLYVLTPSGPASHAPSLLGRTDNCLASVLPQPFCSLPALPAPLLLGPQPPRQPDRSGCEDAHPPLHQSSHLYPSRPPPVGPQHPQAPWVSAGTGSSPAPCQASQALGSLNRPKPHTLPSRDRKSVV